MVVSGAQGRDPRIGLYSEALSLKEKECLQLFRMGEEARPALHTHTQDQARRCTQHLMSG